MLRFRTMVTHEKQPGLSESELDRLVAGQEAGVADALAAYEQVERAYLRVAGVGVPTEHQIYTIGTAPHAADNS
jgi:hypothetical protein